MRRLVVTLTSLGTLAAVATVVTVVALRDRDDATETPDPDGTAATVTVDAGTDLGGFNNPAGYHNQSGPAYLLGPADLRHVDELHPRVTRVWMKPDQYYDAATGRYDFDYRTESGTTYYAYLDQVASYSETLLANVDQCPQQLMRAPDPGACRAVLKNGILHYKQRYPSLRYVELFNEPDKTWEPTSIEQPAMSLEEYYRWYKIGYQVVNEVNSELAPGVPLEVGGPASYTFNTAFLKKFLDLYRDDPDPAKRLDFLSYHEYKRREAPAEVETEKKTAREWLTDRGLNPDTPVFVTEYGVFPGSNTGTAFDDDVLTQAAAMETLAYYYARGGIDMAMHWVFDHLDNERKSMFVEGHDGAVYPYYNVVRMQRMLKSTRVEADSTSLSRKGIGVNALATKDSGGIAVLATNYQWTTGRTRYLVRMAVRNLPAGFSGQDVRVQRYLVDAATSNYTRDPNHAGLQRVEDRVVPAATAVTATFPLDRNAMSLLVFTPVRGSGQ